VILDAGCVADDRSGNGSQDVAQQPWIATPYLLAVKVFSEVIGLTALVELVQPVFLSLYNDGGNVGDCGDESKFERPGR
jgi:hypothetical protein